MARIQIQLTDEQYRGLRRWARRLGVSLPEAVRRCVADRVCADKRTSSQKERVRAALAVCGKYVDPAGEARLAAEHDRHLAGAYRRLSSRR